MWRSFWVGRDDVRGGDMPRELAGLFLDDGALALTIVAVVAPAGAAATLVLEVPLTAGAILPPSIARINFELCSREPNLSFRIFSSGQLQRNEPMKLAIALLAAGIGLAATAASAEETRIGVGVGPVGAGVTVGSGHDRDRDRDRERTTIIKRDAEPRERTTIIKKEHEEPDRKVIIKDRD
jgi:hypothetical protein